MHPVLDQPDRGVGSGAASPVQPREGPSEIGLLLAASGAAFIWPEPISDDLAGALSRCGLRELGECLLAQQHMPSDIAVLMVDADHFKVVNDRHGHLAGDDVLRHLTRILRDNLRADALLARYDGEEFTVLLPVRHREDALTVAERLREMVARSPCESRKGRIHVTVSIGLISHERSSTLEDDLSRADALLYRAKAGGRNRVVAEAA